MLMSTEVEPVFGGGEVDRKTKLRIVQTERIEGRVSEPDAVEARDGGAWRRGELGGDVGFELEDRPGACPFRHAAQIV